jgi:hypothetical protein
MSSSGSVKAQPVPPMRSIVGSTMSALSFDVTMQRLVNSEPDSVSSLPRLTPLNVNPCASASCWIARSRLWMALWLSEVTPTRLPCLHQRDGHARALPGLARSGRPLDEQVARSE